MAIYPVLVPIPAIITNLINKGMNWIALFDHVWAIKGTIKVPDC
jgi:hypothetical protein